MRTKASHCAGPAGLLLYTAFAPTDRHVILDAQTRTMCSAASAQGF